VFISLFWGGVDIDIFSENGFQRVFFKFSVLFWCVFFFEIMKKKKKKKNLYLIAFCRCLHCFFFSILGPFYNFNIFSFFLCFGV
jgi:CDP-diglyceride synthetase